jgi:ribosome-binding factor A
MKPYRLARVAEAIREVASETILFKLNDPRIKNVTVTRAEISPDLQHAKVYVTIMGTPQEQKLCLNALRQAAGFIQRKIGDRLQIRYTPTVRFLLDKGVLNTFEVTRLLKEAQGRSGSEAEPGVSATELPEESPQADEEASPGEAQANAGDQEKRSRPGDDGSDRGEADLSQESC